MSTDMNMFYGVITVITVITVIIVSTVGGNLGILCSFRNLAQHCPDNGSGKTIC